MGIVRACRVLSGPRGWVRGLPSRAPRPVCCRDGNRRASPTPNSWLRPVAGPSRSQLLHLGPATPAPAGSSPRPGSTLSGDPPPARTVLLVNGPRWRRELGGSLARLRLARHWSRSPRPAARLPRPVRLGPIPGGPAWYAAARTALRPVTPLVPGTTGAASQNSSAGQGGNSMRDHQQASLDSYCDCGLQQPCRVIYVSWTRQRGAYRRPTGRRLRSPMRWGAVILRHSSRRSGARRSHWHSCRCPDQPRWTTARPRR